MKTIVLAPLPGAGRCMAVTTALIALLVALLWPGGAMAGVRASFDRPTVYEGDTVTLTIEVDGAKPGGEPDLSPLAQAFDVLGTSTGSQISIINGRSSSKFSWRISLSPKTLGEIQVAPIQVGTEQTPPLSLTVAEVPEGAQGAAGDDVYVELELGIDGDQVMVQQQVPVVVRLYSAVPIRGGELSAPSADGAILERLGEDSQYRTQRNGRDYQVIERRFSLSPQRSGELRIAPVQFQGELMGTGRAAASDRFGRLFNDPMMDRMFGDMSFPMLQRGEPVRARSSALTLQVKPRAEGFGGEHWLPAEAVAIDDSWATQPPRLRVGEPATRTLTITAKGLAGAQIPEIELPAPAGMRVYPEKTETESRTDGAMLYGVSAQRVTLIPTSGGRVEMPELRVTWWDTVAETERVATVPAMTLEVEGPAAPVDDPSLAAGQAPHPGSVSAPASEASQAEQAADRSGQDTGRAAPTTDRSIDLSWPIWLGIALLALAAGTLALPWYRRRRSVAASAAPPAVKPSSQQQRHGPLREALRDACERNDASGAAKALLAWAQALWSDDAPVNLSAVAARIKQGAGPGCALAAEQVRLLERRLYARDAGPWDGEALWLVVKNGLGGGSASQRSDHDDLAPLYPKRV